MLFEEEEMLVIADELTWDSFGHGEVGADHRRESVCGWFEDRRSVGRVELGYVQDK
jgi:hypothetical protein